MFRETLAARSGVMASIELLDIAGWRLRERLRRSDVSSAYRRGRGTGHALSETRRSWTPSTYAAESLTSFVVIRSLPRPAASWRPHRPRTPRSSIRSIAVGMAGSVSSLSSTGSTPRRRSTGANRNKKKEKLIYSRPWRHGKQIFIAAVEQPLANCISRLQHRSCLTERAQPCSTCRWRRRQHGTTYCHTSNRLGRARLA